MGSSKVNKSICISFPSEAEYGKLVEDKKAYRAYLNKAHQQDREIFPAEMKSLHIPLMVKVDSADGEGG